MTRTYIPEIVKNRNERSIYRQTCSNQLIPQIIELSLILPNPI